MAGFEVTIYGRIWVTAKAADIIGTISFVAFSI